MRSSRAVPLGWPSWGSIQRAWWKTSAPTRRPRRTQTGTSFEALLAPKGKPPRCCSWNARSLLAVRPKSRARKLAYLKELLGSHDVVLVQEVEGVALVVGNDLGV